VSKRDLAFLETIPYPPIARVMLGFRRDQAPHPLDGFGFLTPSTEGLRSLGVFFSSSLFEKRAPEGHVALNVFLGGSRAPELCEQGTEAALEAALADVRRLLHVQGDPVFHDSVIIPHSIPQYEVGFGKVKDAMRQFELSSPGVFLAGCYRDGISVGDSMLSGLNSAQRIAEFLRNDARRHTSYQHRVA
jgi:oxygen-dependent protoporphyrinogen oxidase